MALSFFCVQVVKNIQVQSLKLILDSLLQKMTQSEHNEQNSQLTDIYLSIFV